MPVTLRTLDARATLANLQELIRDTELLGFELIALAKGFINSLPANVVTFHPHTTPLQQVTLEVVDASLGELQQQAALTERENQGETLISHGVVFVQGQEMNVAAYRG
jgi:hypothetical protein